MDLIESHLFESTLTFVEMGGFREARAPTFWLSNTGPLHFFIQVNNVANNDDEL